MPQSISRALELDVEKCVEQIGLGRFDLVLIAAARSREIRRHNKESNNFEHLHSSMTALLEIQEGKINGLDYLKKIKFPEPRSMIDRGANFK